MIRMKEAHKEEVDKMDAIIRQKSSTELIAIQEEMADGHRREVERLNEEHKKEIAVRLTKMFLAKT